MRRTSAGADPACRPGRKGAPRTRGRNEALGYSGAGEFLRVGTSPQTHVWSEEGANRQPMRAIAYCRNLPVVASGFGTLQAYCTSRGGDPEYSTEFWASAAIATGRGGLLKFEAACNLLLRSGLRVPAVVSLEAVFGARGRRKARVLRAELSGVGGVLRYDCW